MPKNAPFRPVGKDWAKTKNTHFEPRLPFRAIFGSGVVRRSKKEISPSEVERQAPTSATMSFGHFTFTLPTLFLILFNPDFPHTGTKIHQ
jgi:hypothetical protein